MFIDRYFPSPFLKQEADESLNFEEQILEAAKSIAAATSALVKAASAAQRELVAQGKVCVIPTNGLLFCEITLSSEMVECYHNLP